MSEHQLVLLLVLASLVAAATYILVRPQRSQAPRASPEGGPFNDASSRDDDRYWPWGLVYDNPDDPALFVPKRYGLGWAVNIGHPGGRLLLVGALALAAVLVAVEALSSS